MKSHNIHSTVMRRVYYSYVLSVVSSVVFWQGMFLGAAALLLARWLHVASIYHNFLSIPVGKVPQYLFNSVWGAVTHGEVVMVATLLLTVIVTLSVGYHLAQAVLPRLLGGLRA